MDQHPDRALGQPQVGAGFTIAGSRSARQEFPEPAKVMRFARQFRLPLQFFQRELQHRGRPLAVEQLLGGELVRGFDAISCLGGARVEGYGFPPAATLLGGGTLPLVRQVMLQRTQNIRAESSPPWVGASDDLLLQQTGEE